MANVLAADDPLLISKRCTCMCTRAQQMILNPFLRRKRQQHIYKLIFQNTNGCSGLIKLEPLEWIETKRRKQQQRDTLAVIRPLTRLSLQKIKEIKMVLGFNPGC